MKINDSKIDKIVSEVADSFRCFGGGKANEFNPISIALAEKPPMFAAGVDVRSVVEFVLREAKVLK